MPGRVDPGRPGGGWLVRMRTAQPPAWASATRSAWPLPSTPQPPRSRSKSPLARRLPSGWGGALSRGPPAAVLGAVRGAALVGDGAAGEIGLVGGIVETSESSGTTAAERCGGWPRTSTTVTAAPAASTTATPPAATSHRRGETALGGRPGVRCRGLGSDTAAQSNHIHTVNPHPRHRGPLTPRHSLSTADLTGDAAEDAVDEAAGIVRGQELGELDRLVQDHGGRDRGPDAPVQLLPPPLDAGDQLDRVGVGPRPQGVIQLAGQHRGDRLLEQVGLVQHLQGPLAGGGATPEP